MSLALMNAMLKANCRAVKLACGFRLSSSIDGKYAVFANVAGFWLKEPA